MVLLAVFGCLSESGAQDNAKGIEEESQTLHDVLDLIRVEFRLPALAGAIVTDSGVSELAAVGRRKIDDPTPVTDHDLWHLGSCTKAMTATMIATLIEDQKLSWTSTLADVFPDDATSMDEQCRGITLTQLMTHRSGLLANGPWRELGNDETPTQQRRVLLQRMTKNPPLTQPGTTYLYSNVGFALAGLMAETVTGQSWETLMRERLFTPLKMDQVGFGVAGAIDSIEQPWGHRSTWLGIGPLKALQMDNASSLGPAGTVHASLRSWAKFIALHLNPKNEIVAEDTWTHLHTPPAGTDYAMGWNVAKREWAGSKALHHSGSNTINFCVCWLAPNRKFAVIAATNTGQTNAPLALDKAASEMIKRRLKSVDP